MGNGLFLSKKLQILASILVALSVDRWLWLSADTKIIITKPKQIRNSCRKHIDLFKKELFEVILLEQNRKVCYFTSQEGASYEIFGILGSQKSPFPCEQEYTLC